MPGKISYKFYACGDRVGGLKFYWASAQFPSVRPSLPPPLPCLEDV